MEDQVTEDRVRVIVSDSIHEYDTKVQSFLTKQDLVNSETSKTLAGQNVTLERIEGRLTAIYGNGSGRKCILDRIEDRQNVHDKILEDERKEQESFRDEVRKQISFIKGIEEQKIKEEAEADIQAQETRRRKDKNKEWVRWVLGGVALVAWECFKKHYKI